jgi:hypothetical protein
VRLQTSRKTTDQREIIEEFGKNGVTLTLSAADMGSRRSRGYSVTAASSRIC